MNVIQEYERLCRDIDHLQVQLFKQGKRYNVFLLSDLESLQQQLKQLIQMATERLIQSKPDNNYNVNKPKGR